MNADDASAAAPTGLVKAAENSVSPAAMPIAAAPEASTVRQRFPVLTLLACAICALVFLGLFNEPNPNSWETLAKYGCYASAKIYGGAVWGFITSAFVHVELWHVAFNVYWLWVLGSRLERVIGSGYWLGFVLAAAFVSSGMEFAFTGTTGIGASGVGYALFGFLWITRKRYPAFQAVLDPRTIILFVAWLAGCFIATAMKIWTVGNAAHLAGLLFGAGLGAWVLFESRRRLIAFGLTVMFVIAIVPVFWAPWSSDWTSYHALRAHQKGEYASAIKWYQRSMNLGQDKAWCWQNMALAYLALGDKAHFQETVRLLRGVDEKAAAELEGSAEPKTN
jgi:membrane associated rhomboid family serine protease